MTEEKIGNSSWCPHCKGQMVLVLKTEKCYYDNEPKFIHEKHYNCENCGNLEYHETSMTIFKQYTESLGI